jgi:hypothetical protein
MPGTHPARGGETQTFRMPIKDAARLYQAGAARNDASGDPSKFRVRVLSRDNSRPMLEKRKSPRKKMVLPVKVWIDKDTQLAHTIDIARTGARLGGLRQQLQVGMIVTLQRGSKKAKFQITWVRQLAATEVHAGVEALEPQDEVWGISLSDRGPEDKKETQAFLMLLSNS